MKKLLIIAAIFCNLVIVSCASLPRTADIPVHNTRHIIYVVYRHWHTSIVLDAQQLAAQSPLLAMNLRGEKFARVGWGDGDYFTGKNKSVGSATKALVASGYSALQLLTYKDTEFRDIPPDTIVPLAISNEGLSQLIKYINTSLDVDAKGHPVPLESVGEDAGIFFRAADHYSMFNNCNTWTGASLRVAGLPLTSRLTAQGVFKQAQEISRIQAEAGLFKAMNK